MNRNKYGKLSKGRSDGDGEGVMFWRFCVTVGLIVGGGLLIWIGNEAHNHYNPFCSGNCCKQIHTYDEWQFRETGQDLCFDSSLSEDDNDCDFKFFPITYGSVDGSDAVGGYGVEDDIDGFVVDSRPFELTYPGSGSGPVPGGGLDHVHWLSYVGDRAGDFKAYSTHVPGSCASGSELVYEGNVTCQVDTAYATSPYSQGDAFNFYEDFRLAACGFNTIALPQHNPTDAWQVADFFFTNKAIFIINERLPFGKIAFGGPGPDYAAYTEVVKVATRNPEDYHKVAIAYNSVKGTIRYLLDDQEVYRVTRPGYTPEACNLSIYHGGPDQAIFPEAVSVGFGTFSILDGFSWDYGGCFKDAPLAKLDSTPGAYNYYEYHDAETGDAVELPSGYFAAPTPDVTDRIWGQGARMAVDWMRVGVQRCGCAA